MKIVETLPETGLERPNPEQLHRLRAIVLAAHPWLNDHSERAFARALLAIGYMFRLPEPTPKVYFHAHLESANRLLDRLGIEAVDGIALLCAVLAHADICWRESSKRYGELLEVGLDPHSGARWSNAWRGILDGSRGVLPPVRPRERFAHAVEAAQGVSIWKQENDGSMRRVADAGPLWR